MAHHNKIIMIVDDDAEDRLLIKDAFDELHYGECIHFEENGETAIKYLQGCLDRESIPGVIIIDLNMPKLNGRQTLKWIKSQEGLKHVSVVIFSTSLNPIEKEECLALGAHSYVIKPISYRESITIAENFLSLTGVVHQDSIR